MAPKKKKTSAAANQKLADCTPNVSHKDDAALAKAYISCTGNSLCGVEQKSAEFWFQLEKKYWLLVCESDILVPAVKLNAASLKN